MANNDKENKIEKFTKEAIGKTLNQFNKEIGMTDLVEVNKNQDRILNGILSQVNDENTEKTEKSNIITLDNSTDGIVELKEIQGDTNVNVSKIEEMSITHDIGDKEGNVFTLNEITKGAISIGEIQGNTMVNCNKEADKELILMEDLSTEGYSNITLNKGVDGGLVDVALEGNTMVNVCDQKNPIAVTKSYTVENSGNHVALQGEYDGKCRPVVNGNTLVNLSQINKATLTSNESLTTDLSMIKPSTTYTRIVIVEKNTLSPANSSEIVASITNISADERKIDLGFTGIIQFTFTTPSDLSGYSVCERIRVYAISTEGELAIKDLLLEGDYTNKPIPDYFDGLQSSFEDRVVPERLAHFPSTILTTPSSGYTHREFGDTLSLKPSTTYTIVQKAYKTANHSPVNTNAHPYTLVFGGRQGVSDSWIVRATPPVGDIKEGVSVYTLTTPNDFVISIQTFIVIVEENKGSEFELEVSIFEGDYTNYNFSDYDPTKVGKYRVDYKVTGKNKAYGLKQQIPDVLTTKINVTKGKSYTYSTQNIADGTCRISICDSEPYNNESLSNAEIQLISDWGGGNHTWVSEVTGTFWFIIWQRDITINSNSTLQIEEGTTATSYEPYKEGNKTLYLNSPLLEGDTIEEYGNNIVHIHRSNKVVLDGGASPWGNTWWESTSNTTDTVFSGGLSSAPYEDIGYCDKLLIVTPSNLSSYDTAITIDGESIIRVNIPKTLLSGNKYLPAFRTWLNDNPVTFVGKLKTPQYEVISTNDELLTDSYVNGHLDVDSIVPIEKVSFRNWKINLKYLYPSTKYTVQFEADNTGSLRFSLGGSSATNLNIIKGINKFNATTPSSVDNTLFVNGIGFNASNIVVTPAIEQEFGYFEGMKSVGECEGNEIEILSHNGNLYKRLENSYYKTYGSGVIVVEDNEDSFIFEVNDWDKGISYLISTEGLFKNKKYKLTWEKYNELAIPQLHASGITLLNSNKRVKEQVSFEKISNVDWNFELPDSFEQGDILEIRFKTSIASGQNGACNICINEIGFAKNTALSKLNKQQLTHEPLRAVGDIKDKYVLIDGKWYIERNTAEVDISTLTWNTSLLDNNDIVRYWASMNNKHPKQGSYVKCNILPNYRYNTLELRTCEGIGIKSDSDTIDIGINLHKNKNILDSNSLVQWITNNSLMITYQLDKPTYEPVEIAPTVNTYTDVTHITNNSTIPCNMTIKNTGFNCLLKPNTTYTISSNLGLNTVTTGADIGDSCLRFYDEDTSTKTTMRNVLILEGDWTSKPDLIPANFSGIESAFEQELVTDENDVNYGKYKVTARVVGKNLFDGNYNNGFISKVNNYFVYKEANIGTQVAIIKVTPGVTYRISKIGGNRLIVCSSPYKVKDGEKLNLLFNNATLNNCTVTIPYANNYLYVYVKNETNSDNVQLQIEQGDIATEYEPYKENNITFYLNKPLRGVESVKDRVYVKDDKVVVERNCSSVTFDGSDAIKINSINDKTIEFHIHNSINKTIDNMACICNTIPYGKYGTNERVTPYATGVYITINKNKLSTQDIDGFRQWLQQNPTTVVYQLAEPTYEEVEYSSNRLILNTFNNESFNNSTLFLDTNISPKLSFKPLYEELVYVKNSTKYYIQFNAVGSGEVVINLGGTELTTEIVEGYNYIPITTPSESTNLMTISGQGITISEVVVSEVICGGYYKGIQSCFEEHMENGKYRVLLRGIALDGSKVNGIKLYINEPLRGIGDIKDRLCIKNGKLMVERNYDSVTLDGTGDAYDVTSWGASSDKTIEFRLGYNQFENKKRDILCDNFISETSNLWLMDTEGIQSYTTDTVDIRINKTRLSTQDVAGFRQWLQQNPTTIVYQLVTPQYEEVTNEYGLPIVFEGYENGVVYIDSSVTPTTHIKYTSNNQLATTLSKAEEQNISTQEDINMNVVTYMMDIDMILTEMEMSNDTSVMAVRRDSSNENMLDRMSKEDKKVYQDNTVVMLEKMITANVLEKEDIERRINMYYNKNRISKEQYEYLKSLL